MRKKSVRSSYCPQKSVCGKWKLPHYSPIKFRHKYKSTPSFLRIENHKIAFCHPTHKECGLTQSIIFVRHTQSLPLSRSLNHRLQTHKDTGRDPHEEHTLTYNLASTHTFWALLHNTKTDKQATWLLVNRKCYYIYGKTLTAQWLNRRDILK